MHIHKSFLVKAASFMLVVGLLLGFNLIPGTAASQNLTFTPQADAYVDSSSPSVNYGTGNTLRVDSSPTVESFIRFTVSGLSGKAVTQAQLKIYANSTSSSGLVVKSVADNSWGETTVTYTSAPAQGSTLASTTSVTGGSWITLDVTSFVKADGTFSFGVTTSGSTAISLGARECGTNAPQLVVTVNDVGTATPPAVTSTPGSGTQTLTPSADSYIDAGHTSTNYGTLSALRVDGSPIVNSYLRFVVPNLGGQAISQAQLLIHATSASPSGLVAKSVADNSWGETTITYANAPAQGNTLSTSPAVVSNTWVTLDVTSYVTAPGTYSFGVSTTGSTAIALDARESGANAPKLVLHLNGSGTPVPTQVKTNTPVPTQAKTNTPAPTQAKTNTPAPTQAKTNTPVPTSVSGCTAVILTKGPTLIFTGNNTQMRVFWQWTSNVSFQLQWGTDTSYSLGSAAVSAYDTTNHLYKYDVSGLNPGSKYYYRVVTGSQCSVGSFFAAPAASATSLKFLSYGDTRTNGSIHNGLAGQIDNLFKADPAFQTLNLNVGDWVSADSSSAWSGEWFNTSYTNLRYQDANISDIGVRGNHEGGASQWKMYWPEPFQSGGLYWSFDYGPMHVAMLDQYTSYTPGSAQYNWLRADLAASTKTWKFVVFHEPGWSAGGGHANNTTVQNDLQPLFQQYGVSVTFSGHNHYYARASVNGVTELTLGGGGAPQYTPASGQPDIVVTSKSYSFGEFTINGNTLTAKIVNSSGATVDTFTITR